MPDSMITQAASGAPALATDVVPVGRPGLAAPRGLTLDQVLALRRAPPNAIINGAMEIAQRSANYAITTSAAYGAVDRWAFTQVGAANAHAVQGGSLGDTAFPKCCYIGRNAGAVETGDIVAAYVMESADARRFAGKQITVSLRAMKGANFSAAGSLLKLALWSGTGIDQSAQTLIYVGWTGGAAIINTTQALTGAVARYNFQVTVPANATQLGLQLYYTPTGVAGADDNLYFTDVRLHEGPDITNYAGYRLFAEELTLCQRYFERMGNAGVRTNLGAVVWSGTASGQMPIHYAVPKRVSPTVTFVGSWRTLGANHGGAVTLAYADGNAYPSISVTAGAAQATGVASMVQSSDALDAYVDVSAEL